jgi:hypothetical protein
MTNLSRFTINARKSRCQRQFTFRLGNEDRLLLVWVNLLFLYAGSSIQRGEWAICLVYRTFFIELRSSSNNPPPPPPKKELSLEILMAEFR